MSVFDASRLEQKSHPIFPKFPFWISVFLSVGGFIPLSFADPSPNTKTYGEHFDEVLKKIPTYFKPGVSKVAFTFHDVDPKAVPPPLPDPDRTVREKLVDDFKGMFKTPREFAPLDLTVEGKDGKTHTFKSCRVTLPELQKGNFVLNCFVPNGDYARDRPIKSDTGKNLSDFFLTRTDSNKNAPVTWDGAVMEFRYEGEVKLEKRVETSVRKQEAIRESGLAPGKDCDPR